MFRQALDVAFDCLSNVVGRVDACSPLRNTAGQSGTRGSEHAVLILFEVNTILHHPAFYQSVEPLPAVGSALNHTNSALPSSEVHLLRGTTFETCPTDWDATRNRMNLLVGPR